MNKDENETKIEETEISDITSNEEITSDSQESKPEITQEPVINNNQKTISNEEYNKLRQFQRIAESQAQKKQETKLEPTKQPTMQEMEERFARIVSEQLTKNEQSKGQYKVARDLVNKISSESNVTDVNIVNALYKKINESDINTILNIPESQREGFVKEVLLKKELNILKENYNEVGNTQGIMSPGINGSSWLEEGFSKKVKESREKSKNDHKAKFNDAADEWAERIGFKKTKK